ncbi:MAG: c-type cytochrome [Myxococcales bacterium]|nr:c-type cytochrome [Myxococcales bacterium]
MRLRRIAVALGTLTAASVLAHAERVAAKRMVMDPADMAPPGFQLTGRALGGATPPTGIDVAAAAHLAGSAIATVGADQALVIDADSGDLVLVDGAGKAKARLAIGATASQLVFDATARRAYVAARGSDEIVAVDVGAKLTVARRWATPTEPFGVALTPDRATLLVTTVAARTLAAYDVATGAERWRRALAPEPRGVAIAPDGSTAIVTSLTTGSVERIELATPQAGASVSLAPTVASAAPIVFGQLAGPSEAGRSHARNAFAARFVGHDLALVAHQTSTPLQDARFGENRGSYGGGFEPPIKHEVTFIATDRRASRTVSALIADHQPKAIAWDPIRDRAFIVGYGSDSLLVLGAASQRGVKLDRTVAISDRESCGPDGVAVGADGTAWVFCAVSRKVVRVPMDDGAVAPIIAAEAVAPTRMSKQAHEGFDLFRKGNDGRISSRGAMACSSCHPEAGSDGLSWRIETHELQTPFLAGRVMGTHPYKWDGGDRDLAISLTSTMRRLGGGGLTPGQTKSLAAYLETLPRPRVPARAPTAVARGKALFESDEVGCTTCHGGKLYTDNATHELGGTLTQSDTPSLVGLARSAPYYHDGSAATLDALLAERAAVHGMAETVSLTATQRQDLIAYLETL